MRILTYNYAKNITKSGENAIVVTPTMPGADDSAFPFPVLRYPSIDTRRLVGYVAGYPFSPETASTPFSITVYAPS